MQTSTSRIPARRRTGVIRILIAAAVSLLLLPIAPQPAEAAGPRIPAGVTVPEFVTETDRRGGWIDCAWASAAMLADNATGGRLRIGRAPLRLLSGDPEGGSPLSLTAETLHLVGVDAVLSPSAELLLDWRGLTAALSSGRGVVLGGEYSRLPAHYTRWDRRFAASASSHHAVYLAAYDVARHAVLLMDPLGRWNYHGEWISEAALRAFAWTDARGHLNAVVSPDRGTQALAGAKLSPASASVSGGTLSVSAPITAHAAWQPESVSLEVSFERIDGASASAAGLFATAGPDPVTPAASPESLPDAAAAHHASADAADEAPDASPPPAAPPAATDPPPDAAAAHRASADAADEAPDATPSAVPPVQAAPGSTPGPAATAAPDANPATTTAPLPGPAADTVSPAAERADGVITGRAAIPTAPGVYRVTAIWRDGLTGGSATAGPVPALAVAGPLSAAWHTVAPGPVSLSAGAAADISVIVTNTGSDTWSTVPGAIDVRTRTAAAATAPRLLAVWSRADGGVAYDSPPTVGGEDLPALSPGGMVPVTVHVVAPAAEGDWLLRLDLADALSGPLSLLGVPEGAVLVTVTAPQPPQSDRSSL
jgi:hypothetical protein